MIGLLEKHGEGYAASADTAFFLNRRSPAFIGTAVQFLNNDFSLGAYRDVATAVRQGGTALSGDGSVDPNQPIWVEFARGMAPLVKPSAMFIAELALRGVRPDASLKVLDIAAGHGLFGIEIASRHPRAEVYAVDWSAVLEVATENAAAAGVSDRYHLVPGSAFDVELGHDYDVALLTNFFHHFDRDTCIDLMKKVRAALGEDGRAITLEFVPNADRVSPPIPAAFSFIMLNTTRSGDAYTYSELEGMFTAAGFATSELHPLPGFPQSVIVSQG